MRAYTFPVARNGPIANHAPPFDGFKWLSGTYGETFFNFEIIY